MFILLAKAKEMAGIHESIRVGYNLKRGLHVYVITPANTLTH